jgi:hypothetical protein
MSSSFTSFKRFAGSSSIAIMLAAVSLSALGCGAVDPAELDSEGDDSSLEAEVTAETRQAAVAGCIRGESRQAVGDAFDLLTGASGSFPFNDNFTACETANFSTRTDMRFFSDSYEFERAMTSGVSVEGNGAYGPYSASASIKSQVESKVKFSRSSIVFMVDEEIKKAKVTLDADVPYSPLFEQYLAAGNKLSLHNSFGDAFVKTAHIGHRMRLIFTANVERTDKYRKEDFQAVLKATYSAASVGGSVTVSGFSSTQVTEMSSKMNISVLAITHSTNIPEIRELTLAEVKGVLTTFRAAAANHQGVTIQTELVPFGQHGGKAEAQFFDWRSRVASIDTYGRYYNQAKQIADLNTTFKDLRNRGSSGMTAAQWYIDQYRSPAGFTGSGQGAAAFGSHMYTMKLDADEYRTIVGQSQRLVGTRLGNVCAGVADGTAGYAGAQLAAKTCSNDDGQLFRYDSSIKSLRSVSGHCVDVSGGGAVGRLVLATCGSPSPKSQRWTFSLASRKIDVWGRTRDIAFLTNDLGGHVRAAQNQSVDASGWSRDYYPQFAWQLAY